MYYTYILLCADGSLYTGMTADIKRRIKEHCSGGARAAKYTRSHKPEKLAALWETSSASLACRLEYRIKQLPAAKKRQLTENNDFSVFGGEIEEAEYRRESTEESEFSFDG